MRVTDLRRNPLPGYTYEDSETFTGDAVRHRMGWKGRKLDDLKGRYLRLEFQFQRADLFGFVAAPSS